MSEDLVIEVMRIGEIPNKGHIFGVMTIKDNENGNRQIQHIGKGRRYDQPEKRLV